MADFHQTGAVATLHRLVGYDYAEVERRLVAVQLVERGDELADASV